MIFGRASKNFDKENKKYYHIGDMFLNGLEEKHNIAKNLQQPNKQKFVMCTILIVISLTLIITNISYDETKACVMKYEDLPLPPDNE
jgi:hypothetical protein